MQWQVGWKRGRVVRVLVEKNGRWVHGFGHQHVGVDVVGLEELLEIQLGVVSPTPSKTWEIRH